MDIFDPSIYSVEDLRELVNKAQRSKRSQLRTVVHLPQHEWPAARLFSLEELDERIGIYRAELLRRGCGIEGEIKAAGESLTNGQLPHANRTCSTEAPDELRLLRGTTMLLRSGTLRGTAYVVDSSRLVTADHVVQKLGADEVTLQHESLPLATGCRARVCARDPGADVAVLKVAMNVELGHAVQMASECTENDEWNSFGFLQSACFAGIRLAGVVMDPRARDPRGRPAICLFSPQAAAGMGSPLHGLSGSPVLVRGRLIGHLGSVLPDPGDPTRAANGFLYAVPTASIQVVLGREPAQSY